METVTTGNASQAMQIDWSSINWPKAMQQVRKIQVRIVKAVQEKRWRQVRNLQKLLTCSLTAKQLAVRRVTENAGYNTPGVDKACWSTPEQKTSAIYALKWRGYQPKPLRRVYIPKKNGKWRTLGIPTLYDRAMQTLQKLALEPIAETFADPNSYGFRQGRSAMDAIEQSCSVLAAKNRAEWVLDADIENCFDTISHAWLLDNVPMNKKVLIKWLKAGYIDLRSRFHPTKEGTPQGGVISPLLANMTLDGLEKLLRDNFKRSQYLGKNDKVNLIRYADDFIITGKDPDILEQRVIPLVTQFLKERGLRLSARKTRIKNIREGIDFLGFNLRRYPCGKFLTRPSLSSQKELKRKIKTIVKESRTALQADLIARLYPVLKGWAMYFRHAASKEPFSAIDHWVWETLWRWAKRRHPNKGRKWIKNKYFLTMGNRTWTFGCRSQDKILRTLLKISDIPIQRYTKIKGEANPYDPQWEVYMESRSIKLIEKKLTGFLKKLWIKQEGKCQHCKLPMNEEYKWHAHHKVPRCKGGRSTLENLILLHPACHRQIHSYTAGLSDPDSLIYA